MNTSARSRWLVVSSVVGCVLLGTTGGAVGGALITGADVKNGSLTTKDIKDKTLKTSDLSPSTVTGLTGPRGPEGNPGAPGPDGLNGYQEVSGPPTPLAASASVGLTVSCPAGTTVLGGTHTSAPVGGNLVAGGPEDTDTWLLNIANVTDGPVTVTAHAICTRP